MFKFDVQEPDTVEELDALLKGDVVNLRIDLVGSFPEEYLAAYGGKNHREQHTFLTPHEYGPTDYLLMHRAYSHKIKIEKGVVVLHEDGKVTEAFAPYNRMGKELVTNPQYEPLDLILHVSGIRNSDEDIRLNHILALRARIKDEWNFLDKKDKYNFSLIKR